MFSFYSIDRRFIIHLNAIFSAYHFAKKREKKYPFAAVRPWTCAAKWPIHISIWFWTTSSAYQTGAFVNMKTTHTFVVCQPPLPPPPPFSICGLVSDWIMMHTKYKYINVHQASERARVKVKCWSTNNLIRCKHGDLIQYFAHARVHSLWFGWRWGCLEENKYLDMTVEAESMSNAIFQFLAWPGWRPNKFVSKRNGCYE